MTPDGRDTAALAPRAAIRWPSLGFGGGSSFVGGAGEIDSVELMYYAWSRGLRYFDTAPFYGQGLSEHRFGAALRHYPRDEFLLSTKVGRMLQPNRTQSRSADRLPFDVVYDYGYDAVMRSLEDSLQRLGLASIDILYVHDLSASVLGEAYEGHFRELVDGGYRALDRLRSEGVVRAIGAGMKDVDALLRIAQACDLDCVMLAGGYTLLEQASLPQLLPYCESHGVAVILASPFNSGVLATGAAEGATYFYTPAPPDILERTRAIEAVCARHSVPLGAAALQFPLTHPAIVSVVAGFRAKTEVDTNLLWRDWPIPAALWDDLRAEGLIAQA
jgi:D-threo-aldose 1-dehydrogenase